ncbi:MAG TPA: FixH family protein, partial [Solirubrobacteraceae bacterium]|nr:FixH family protein [Solirubrobacteraceae bacterium]
MRRCLPLLTALAALLVAAPSAHAGGFATVGLSSTPDGVPAGTPWRVDITILQHGRTPLTDVRPSISIASGDTARTVAARPTAKAGVYRAEVVFPHAGRWTYQVRDGFVDTAHTFPPVRIARGGSAAAAPAERTVPAPGDDGVAWGRVIVAGLLLVAAGGVL